MNKESKDNLQYFIRTGAKVLNEKMLTSPLQKKIPQGAPHTNFYHALTKKVSPKYVKWYLEFYSSLFGLDRSQIKIFASSLPNKKAGQVIYKNGTWQILINKNCFYHAFQFSAILAHEMSHIFLHKHGVSLNSEDKNERLTDTVAILAGFGKSLYAVNQNERLDFWALFMGVVRHTKLKIGYLTRSEIKFLSKAKKYMVNNQSLKRWEPIIQKSKPIIKCWACGKKLRLPTLSSVLVVKCPICLFKQQVNLKHDSYPSSILQHTRYWLLDPLLRFGDRVRGFD